MLLLWGLLGVRSVAEEDLGYHLLYGERLLARGEPVDSDLGLYLARRPDGQPRADLVDRGPGNWVDAQGRYRFPNGNWASQLLFALVWRAGGYGGLALLRLALVLSLAGLSALFLARCRVGPLASASALALALPVAEERFWLRPELVGFVVLAALLAAWGPALLRGRPPRTPARVGIVLGTGLFVQLHTYWPLALALTAAAFCGALLRRVREPGASRALAGLLLAQLAVAFLNPWTWRTVLLPLQTLRYLAVERIGRGSDHPWDPILEFLPAFHGRFQGTLPTYAWLGALLVAGVGGLLALRARRHAALASIALFALASAGLRRNLPLAALVALPVAWVFLAHAARAAWRARERTPRWRPAVAGLLVAASLAAGWSVVTNAYYVANGFEDRFGLGLSRLRAPVDALRFVREHAPGARVWTDFAHSSWVAWSSELERGAPVLTNTWAYPPSVLRELYAVQSGVRPWRQVLDPYGVDVVLLPIEPATTRAQRAPGGEVLLPLVPALRRDGAFVPVYVDHRFVVLARQGGTTAELAAKRAISSSRFDAEAFIVEALAVDPARGATLANAGVNLERLALPDAAVTVLRRALELRPNDPDVVYATAAVLHRRGAYRLARGDAAGASDLDEARRLVARCLELRSRHAGARRLLAELAAG